MDIELKVLIPLAALLVVMIAAVLVLVCRYFVWEQICKKNKRYKKVSNGQRWSSGYPKLPPFEIKRQSAVTIQQIKPGEQYTPYVDLNKQDTARKLSKTLYYTDINGRSYRYESLPGIDAIEDYPSVCGSDSRSSGVSDTDATIYSDSSNVQPASSSSFGSERSYPNYKLKKIHRSRFQSEPALNSELYKDEVQEQENISSKRLSAKLQKRRTSRAPSITCSTGGQIEFGLYYEPETRNLEITVNQLIDLTLKPDIFSSVLPVYGKDSKPKTNKVHLVRNADGNIELSDYSNMAFLVYITLLPSKTYSRHTNVVYGTGNVVFNEKFSITGYSTEQLSNFHLCFHALCKFERDGEPIVLGEVKVPLKRIQVSQVLPFMANLAAPEEILDIENYLKPSTDLGYLDIYLAFNPIGQKLNVKIVQATGLPKIGMTGHPNVSIKASLYYCGRRVHKRSTGIKKRARDPVYSYTFDFDLSKDRLPECDVLFEVRHHGPMYRTVIGYVAIGNSAMGEGEKHWKSLLDFSYHKKSHKILSHKPVSLL